ncbi:MAG TPA: hypothetical protein VK978_04600, partial [Candidatus Saccharimonadales bacterium]|nr:hypothetical protein [Candidatus Saccharimonadales bacterium]
MPGVYDDEKQGAKTDDLHRITGISPDEAGAMELEAHNGAAEDIARREGLYNPGGGNQPSGSGGDTGSGSNTDSKTDLNGKEQAASKDSAAESGK